MVYKLKGFGVRPQGGAFSDKTLLSTSRGDLELYTTAQYKKKFAGIQNKVL